MHFQLLQIGPFTPVILPAFPASGRGCSSRSTKLPGFNGPQAKFHTHTAYQRRRSVVAIAQRRLDLPTYGIINCHIFSGFRHCSIPYFARIRVHKPPANGCVKYLLTAAKRMICFRQHKWGAAHAFNTASNRKLIMASVYATPR